MAVAAGLLVAPALSDDAKARTVHVSADGADAGKGTRDAPLRTVQKAVDVASPGDTIRIGPGVYNENVKITKDRLAIIGAGRNSTVIDGGLQDLKSGETKCCFLITGKDLYVANLSFRRGYRALTGRGVGTATITSCHFESPASYCSFFDDTRVTFVNCTMADMPVLASYGLSFDRADVLIVGNWMIGNKRGVMLDMECTGFLVGNLLYNHRFPGDANGILCASKCVDVRIERNYLEKIGGFCIGWRQGGAPVVVNNVAVNGPDLKQFSVAENRESYIQGNFGAGLTEK
ncbi:MAG: pectinesterase family protein [Kiritimatiellae bacterium]|nr:pectinesterase family protein [Kiritimatiellia bacterium]